MPKRPPTSGTRKGNGAGQGTGWGGAAKGSGAGGVKQDFGATTNAQGHTVATPAPLNRAEVRRQRQDAVEAHMFHLALNATEQRDQIAAGKTFMVERKEVAGADGGPLQVIYTWDDGPNDSEAGAPV